MNRIDKLIEELCPDGVEHKTLGQVGEFIRGSGLQKADLREEGVPAVHYGQIHTHYGVWTTKTRSFTDEDIAAKLRHARPGDLLIATTSEDDDAVAKATAWLGDTEVVLSGDAYICRHELEPKYMAYFFQSTSFQDQKRRFISGAKVRRVSGASLEKIRIPVPPLEVQREIVGVLDKFTQLEAELEEELEAELEARRAQFAHYRDALVTQSSDARARLSDLGTFVRGRRFTKDDVVEEGIPSLHYGEIYTGYGTSARQAVRHVRAELRGQLRFAQPGSVIFAGVGETVEDVGKAVAWLGDDPIATHDDTFAFSSDLDPKYVAYAVQTADFHRQKERHVSRAKVKRVGASGLGAIEIPVPPMEEQRRIVDVLDKFDALVNDISIGLPAELAARRKQYEHYRDRLLTFKELTA
ncbi:restriction endonuclease subunit S [Prauserella halophila]|uniref:Restriction endonuclease subunit S n=1 Tax=Prauserella halophila TaxID=185641 RepID=A0ABN1W3L8_9PSEU|nr:restriction endonuclease subunit S [Prauserella halophila]MCP2236252.1 type I restriction enzyme, S subunit [Prauserella halophila]